MSELCGTFSPAFIKITYVLINIDFSVEQFGLCNLLPSAYFFYIPFTWLCSYFCTHLHTSVVFSSELQGETKILKLKNLRPQDYANYSCIASVRNVCGIPDRSVIFRLTNKTGTPHHYWLLCTESLLQLNNYILKKERCRKRKMNCHAFSQLSYSVTVITAKAVHLPPVYHRCSLFPQHPRPSNCW